MKYTKYLLASALVVLLAGSGCNQLSQLTSRNFTLDVRKTYLAAATSTSVTMTDTIDLTKESSDFAQYKGNITNLVVDSAWYEIMSQPTPSTLVINNATYTASAVDGSNPSLFASVSNVNATSNFNMAMEVPMTVNAAGGTALVSLLKNSPYTAALRLNGTTNTAPFAFTVQLHIRFTMTASL